MNNWPRDGALVVGGGGHSELAMVRSLGRRAIPVAVASSAMPLARHSRYTFASLPWNDSLPSQAQAETLLTFAREHRLDGWTLIAGGDASAEVIARHREMLAPTFRFATSSWEVVRDATDKRRSYALAWRTGIPHPKTRCVHSADDLLRTGIDFPAILKPAIKDRSNALVTAKAWKVRSREELIRGYREALSVMDPQAILVQEFVPGSNYNQYSYAALCHDGTPSASLVARRLRQYPTEFGCSTLVETVEAPQLEDVARRLLASMSFSGIVEVEFKLDQRDGAFKLLDINPRAWRWMSLGARAGVDFPYLLYRQCHGDTVEPLKSVAGIRWLRMSIDPIAAAIEFWRGSTTPRSYLNSLRRPIEFSLLSRDDPVPAIVEIPYLIGIEIRNALLPRRALRAKA